MKECAICKSEFAEEDASSSPFTEAGEWLAGEVWDDAGMLCPQCLENRAMLSMMYLHEKNT
ncbi:hypothetical protein [Geotalea sp. SG265]|uniref:hypothetical protein n=1 Tax=Geotalea sp. SG265 TaxID=2922867 RepID=UPI001FAEFF79|nr:hypothetical protein [Geotalea sp. SG265]